MVRLFSSLLLIPAAVWALSDRLGGDFLGVPISNFEAKNLIPNRYIVVYNNTFDDDVIEAKQLAVAAAVKKRNIGKRSLTGQLLSTDVHTFKINAWRGMAIEADDRLIMEIMGEDEVAYVEGDTTVSIAATVAQTNAPAGLIRLSHSAARQRDYIFDNSAGEGITAYIVDTGILTTHTEFSGRAIFGANFVNNVDTDENGHGTHVAGTIGGRTFGVAKNVDLVGVKVLDGEGAGSNSGVIQGMQWVITDVRAKNRTNKAVLNMSLGGDASRAVDAAIAALREAGIVPVVAAGNENQNAGNVSPARAPAAITVGAIDASSDRKASFSNFGASVDIFAPGVNILSCGITSNTATANLSGTSMASPHVAGLAAYLMALENIQGVDALTDRMKDLAAAAGAAGSVVTGAPSGTTTLIANNGNLQ